MKYSVVYLIVFLILSSSAFAGQAGWGVSVEEASKKVKIGGRIQAIVANDSETESQDFFMRRVRLNIDYKPWDGHTFVYDIRNDGANKKDDGEQQFNIGDAYWKIKVDKNTVNNIKLFRSKVDVSYSQTSSSKNLFNPQRANISEHASDFVVHNRRAMNAQVNGNIKNLAYQFVVSDGVNSEDLEDISGKEVTKVNYQKFTYGGKIRYYFMGDAKGNKLQDTFYGAAETFSLGLGYFANDKINVDNSTVAGAGAEFSFRRSVTNIDLSYAVGNFRLLAEHFSFTGDLIDLTASNKEDITGDSSGYYIQTEYLIGKIAPYFIYEFFDKQQGEDDYDEVVQTVGVNYYENMEAQRFGLAYKKTELAKNLGDSTNESIYGYFMLNF